MRDAALLLAAGAMVWAQSASAPDLTRTVRLGGFLSNAVTGEPVRRATVGLQFLGGVRPGQATLTTLADAGGHFQFEGLTPGHYHVWAERRGYPRQNVSPTEGVVLMEDRVDLSFRVDPFAALTGRVVDENNDPISGAEIQLLRSEISQGKREIRPSVSAVTDDRGEYRVATLVSGRYYVSAYARAQSASENSVYPRRFFSGAPDLGTASSLELQAGANRRADFRLSPEPAFRIHGNAAASQELSGLSVVLAPRNAAERFGAVTYPSRWMGGDFEISGVAAGQYVLTVSGYRGTAVQNGSRSVALGTADLDGITLTLNGGADLTGRVIVETGAPGTPTFPGVTVGLAPDDFVTRPIYMARLSAAGPFTLQQVLPGDYTFQASVPGPYYLKSATLGGFDALRGPVTVPESGGTAPLQIILGTNGGEVNGTVKMQDKPAANCMVLMTRPGGASPAMDRFAQTDANGRFLIPQAAPGDYVVYAFRDLAQVEYRNPAELARFFGAAVRVSEDSKQTVELSLNVN